MSELETPSGPSRGGLESLISQTGGPGKPLLASQELEAVGPRDVQEHTQVASDEVSPLSGRFRNSLVSYGELSELSA